MEENARCIFSILISRETSVHEARYKVEGRKFLFEDHFDPTFGIETY